MRGMKYKVKKILLYFISFIFIFFLFPAILTNRSKITSSKAVENKNENNIENQSSVNEGNVSGDINQQNEEYTYQKYGRIKLLHKNSGEVEEVNLDEYLCNVVSAEMPADFELEALKAQAIVARTYTIYKILNKKHENADICDDSTCCQAWISKEKRLERWEESKRESNWSKIETAVNTTKGKIVTYQGQPINAFFHSNSGGITEIPVNVWGGTGYPYLQSVETSGEEGYSQYSSEAVFTQEELLSKLKSKYEDISIDFSNAENIKILEYTEGTRVKTVKIGNHEFSGVEIRTLLGLRSTNFEISRENDKIKFTVKGYGHGVGMSQTGADSLAKQGSKADEIIKHFYFGVEISEVNSL